MAQFNLYSGPFSAGGSFTDSLGNTYVETGGGTVDEIHVDGDGNVSGLGRSTGSASLIVTTISGSVNRYDLPDFWTGSEDFTGFGLTLRDIVAGLTAFPGEVSFSYSFGSSNGRGTLTIDSSATVSNVSPEEFGFDSGGVNVTLSGTAYFSATLTGDPIAASSHFSNDADIIDFNNLTAAQIDAVASGADIYDALGGNDTVELPGLAHYALANGVNWDSSQTFFAGAGNDAIGGKDGNDRISGGGGNDTLDGGGNIDTAVFSGPRGSYTISKSGAGGTVSGPDGSDTIAKIEFLQFSDSTIRFRPGTGSSVDFNAPPSAYMAPIRDFDGNDLGAAGGWLRIGAADIQRDGDSEHIYVNRAIGRWATLGPAEDGLVYFGDHGWGGDTRVVGIYIDPLVQSGHVIAGSDHDSQRRFQNDLAIENINQVLSTGDYDRDGLQEVYFGLTDKTAYLHAYMHADGNIRYANYQSEADVTGFLSGLGYQSSEWSSWLY